MCALYRAEDSQYTTRSEPVYDVPTLQRQELEQKEDYVNLPQQQRDVELSSIRKKHIKSDADTADLKLEGNPSYLTTHYNNL